ncbi:MAG: hypothetical protein E7323_07235 [Clostridiales bacterium]|nr:hypothetical protein [Clostridiales bacterium]
MNGNRSRYSSNPTFSMQKRGLFKKAPSFAPEKPDFTAAPDPAAQQALFTQPSPMQNQPVQGPAYPQAADLFSAPANNANPMGMQPMNPMSNTMSFQPITFQNQQPLQNQMTGSFPMQPQQNPFPQQPQNLPPLGNQQVNAPGGLFSPRTQGFTPPNINQQAPAPLMGAMNAQPVQQPIGSPTVQAANPFEPSPLQQPMNFARNSFGNPQGMQGNQPGFGAPPMPAQPSDPDALWKLYLFLLLPVLFVPCLFVPESMNALRYLFIALCVAGIGVIWYRKMFKDNTRILVTLGYAAACIGLVVMLVMNGSPDTRQPGETNPAQQQATQTFNANGESGAQPTFSPTPEPTPTIAPISEAQTRLEAFMTNWSGARIEDMVRLVQPSWASTQDNPSNRLFVMLGNRTPLSYTIEEISGSDNDSSRTVSMTANIDKNNGKDPTLYRFMVLMVKEGGEWYVDPNSLASNDEVKNNEETNVVNDSKNTAAEDWELPPRQTVTPAPPADQPLYYNPDGGSMYHLDQYCPSIRDEYLPLAGSFPYSDLGSHRDLTPCLKCSAPTQTLPPADNGDTGV